MSDFWKWLQENLFTHNFFDNKFFPHQVTLYSHEPKLPLPKHLQQMEGNFTSADLYAALMKACGIHKMKREAMWFHVNIVDQAVWVLEDYKRYPYPLPHSEKPLATLFWRMEKFPADQGGTTYLGLLSDDKKWLLLLEKGAEFQGADFKISFCGPEDLCKTVRSFLKTKVA